MARSPAALSEPLVERSAAASASGDPPVSERVDSNSSSRRSARTDAGSVRLASVSKGYGDFVALADLDLEIRPGEFLSILGPSGSGKTTTLRIIGGFVHPDKGRVELSGRDVTDLAPNKRDVNTVFQSYALFPAHECRG